MLVDEHSLVGRIFYHPLGVDIIASIEFVNGVREDVRHLEGLEVTRDIWPLAENGSFFGWF